MTDAQFLRDVVAPVCASIPDRKDRINTIADKLENPITVRHVFEKAFGTVPEGATCHIGHSFNKGGRFWWEPFEVSRITPTKFDGHWPEELTGESKAFEFPIGPDISDRDAEAFRGFFGDQYDKALDELLAKRGGEA